MIICSAFRCKTCGQDHVVRIGMGQDNRQEHSFPCRSCGEEMRIAMEVDYDNLGTRTEALENAEEIEEVEGALIVNVHANYVIEEGLRYSDMVFPHMMQMHAHAEAAEADGLLKPLPMIFKDSEQVSPFRRPDFADEWKLLKKAWSLHSRGRDKLADKEREEATGRYYEADPLKDLPDWVWRFGMQMGSKRYHDILMALTAETREAVEEGRMAQLLANYAKGTPERARRYFEVLREYFAGWAEFSQVHFAVARGLLVAEGHVATTSGFHSVRMFYGIAFEVFAPSVDILAFMNNVLAGREWAKFQNVDAGTYLKSDKAKRFDAFAERPAFINLCAERDNQLRNASHHGALHYGGETGLVSYREGKGNAGDLVTMRYADYLARCSAIFFQVVTLLRFELLICSAIGTPYPL